MIYIVLAVFKVILTIFLLVILLGFFRTWQVQNNPLQKEFLNGKFPEPLPNGFLRGSALYTGSWQGKSFDSKNSMGINIFSENGKNLEKYPFKTYSSMGIQDSLETLKIDYSLKENSFLSRLVLDELVETSEGKYLGKIHLMILPGNPFTVGFFKLEKSRE